MIWFKSLICLQSIVFIESVSWMIFFVTSLKNTRLQLKREYFGMNSGSNSEMLNLFSDSSQKGSTGFERMEGLNFFKSRVFLNFEFRVSKICNIYDVDNNNNQSWVVYLPASMSGKSCAAEVPYTECWSLLDGTPTKCIFIGSQECAGNDGCHAVRLETDAGPRESRDGDEQSLSGPFRPRPFV